MFGRDKLQRWFAAVANARPEFPPTALPQHDETVEVRGRHYHYARTVRLDSRARKIPQAWTQALELLQQVSIGKRENETYMYVDCEETGEHLHFAIRKQAITIEDQTIQITVVGHVPVASVESKTSYTGVSYTVSSPGWWMQQLNASGETYQVYFRFGNSVTYCFEPPKGSMQVMGGLLGFGASYIGSYTLEADVFKVAIEEPPKSQHEEAVEDGSDGHDHAYANVICKYWFNKDALATGKKVEADVLQLHQYTHHAQKSRHDGENQFVNLTFDPQYFRDLCLGKQPEITPACKPEEWEKLKKI